MYQYDEDDHIKKPLKTVFLAGIFSLLKPCILAGVERSVQQ